MRFIQTHKQEAMVIGGVLTAAGLIFSQAWLLVLASLVAGLPIAVNAWEALRYKQISIGDNCFSGRGDDWRAD